MVRSMLMAVMFVSLPLIAEVRTLQGSDTLASFMKDAISASNLEADLSYIGGGSGKAVEAMIDKKQGIAPMSRSFKEEERSQIQAAGLSLTEHVIGLDGVGLFVNDRNNVSALSLAQVRQIFSCEIRNWSDFGGLDQAIHVYVRDTASGTTDTFKSLVGLKDFGTCVETQADAEDIAKLTSTEEQAIGYAGLSADREGNKVLSLSRDADSQAYAPTPDHIRTQNYPLSRKLYVYEAKGSAQPSAAEQILLDNILDRSFADPLLLQNEFFTLD